MFDFRDSQLRQAYQLLELSVDATHEEADESYRLLTQIWRPDRFSSEPELHTLATERTSMLELAHKMVTEYLSEPSPAPSEPSTTHPSPEGHALFRAVLKEQLLTAWTQLSARVRAWRDRIRSPRPPPAAQEEAGNAWLLNAKKPPPEERVGTWQEDWPQLHYLGTKIDELSGPLQVLARIYYWASLLVVQIFRFVFSSLGTTLILAIVVLLLLRTPLFQRSVEHVSSQLKLLFFQMGGGFRGY